MADASALPGAPFALFEPKPVTRERPVTTEPRWVRLALIGAALLVLGLFLVLPLAVVFTEALRAGFDAYLSALADPDALSAVRLTLLVALIAVPLNVGFGLCAAWATAKFAFPGRSLLLTLIDLPFSVSPVVAGLLFVLLFGAQSALAPWLHARHLAIVFALPGIVLATAFVTVPFVARELIPLMEGQGSQDEEAALTLGASPLRMLWTVTLPNIRWGLLYGVLLCNARAMGEFGAVSVVSGRVAGETNTIPLQIEYLNAGNDLVSAFALSTLLAGLALVTLVLKTVLEWRYGDELAHGPRH